MNLGDVISVLITLGGAIYIAIHRKDLADRYHRLFNDRTQRPDRKRGPKWWRWRFRPSHRQATVMSWLTILFLLLLSVALGIRGFA